MLQKTYGAEMVEKIASANASLRYSGPVGGLDFDRDMAWKRVQICSLGALVFRVYSVRESS